MIQRVCFLLLLLNGVQAISAEKISPWLQSTIRNTDPGTVYRVWIEFVDKGSQSVSQFTATDLISFRAIERRGKVRTTDVGVDFHDLPVWQEYVNILSLHVHAVRQRSKWFNSVSATATAVQIAAIEKLPFVRSITLVATSPRIELPEADPTPLGSVGDSPFTFDYGPSLAQVQLINVPPLHDAGNFGQGVLVGVFDNGFRLLTHEVFDSLNIQATYDFVDHKVSVVPNHPSPAFGTHGVNTLSVLGGKKEGQLIGPAFGATFLLARTENDSSETPVEEDNWVAAIEWAESLGVDVTSTSLGYLTYDPPYPGWTWQNMDGNTTLITRAADMAVARGVVVVNSAGNNGLNTSHNTLNAPADGEEVLSIGAVAVSGSRANFSSVGPTTSNPPRIKPDVMATGVNVIVASGNSPTSYLPNQGTSLSCPLAAGVVALILSAAPNATPAQVAEALRSTGSRASTPDNLMGWGIIDAVAAVNYLTLPNQPTGLRVAGTPSLSSVTLRWTTLREEDNAGFEIQRASNTPQNFSPLPGGFVPGAGTSTTTQSYSYTDTSATVGRWHYRIRQINLDGSSTLSNSIEVVVELPTTFSLLQNYPNPFNPRTTISYLLPEQSAVSLQVYNMLGQLVRTLVVETQAANTYYVDWDGRNEAGEIVATGPYYYRLTAKSLNGDRSFTDDRKMIFLK